MSTPRWLVLGAIAIVALIALGAVVRTRPDDPPTGAGPSTAISMPTHADPAGSPSVAAVSTPSPAPSAIATTGPTPSPTAAAPALTKPPRSSGDPRLAYAEFLLRINEDRATVDRLNTTLAAATEARDLTAVRRAAVAILDFADIEDDWLREHPPADCYAAAHASAGAMLDAYRTAADRFVDWSAAGGGLGGLAALGRAVDAAGAAADALTAFGDALEATSCPA